MSIEGLGKKFQEARKARGLSLEEAARLTKIRQSRLAEIEAEDFSNFPSLAYAKGFLQIYGKFLQVDVSPYLEAFETSEHITVDGYSYLQDNPVPKPARTHMVRQSDPSRTSILPLLIGLAVLFFGFWFIRFILNVQRIAPRQTTTTATPTPGATVATIVASSPAPAQQPAPRVAVSVAPTTTPAIAASATIPSAVAVAPAISPSPSATEPEVRRAQPVRPEDLIAAASSNDATALNRIEIRPLRKTYVQVKVDDDSTRPAFERWISPADGAVQLRGNHFNVRVLDREAVQIRKNGKLVSAGDADVTIE